MMKIGSHDERIVIRAAILLHGLDGFEFSRFCLNKRCIVLYMDAQYRGIEFSNQFATSRNILKEAENQDRCL